MKKLVKWFLSLFKKTPKPTPSKTPQPPRPTPILSSVFTSIGRTVPDQTSGSNACTNYLAVRSYETILPLSSLSVGDYIYDTYPGSPTNGGNNWVALKTGGVGQGYAFQIDSLGQIVDTYTC